MAIGIEQRAGLSFVLTHFRRCLGQPANRGTKRKTRLGIPQVGGALGVG